MDYFVNVSISAAAYLPFAVFLVLLAFALPYGTRLYIQVSGASGDKAGLLMSRVVMVRKMVLACAGVVLALAVLAATMLPANTYKHAPVDRSVQNRQIEDLNRKEADVSPKEVRDVSRQPALTSGEREERFRHITDYRK